VTTKRIARAATDDRAADPVMRSRTYAIPFEQVWQAATRLADGGLRGWTMSLADDLEGVITAEARGVTGAIHDVTLHLGLDDDAQTYVEALVVARKPGSDFGRARRRLRRVLLALDRALAGSARAAVGQQR
jgi:hypothetical protein